MKKLLPLILALALALPLAACGAQEAGPAATAPLKVLEEAEPVGVTVVQRELSGEAKEVFDALSRSFGGQVKLYDYESDGASAVQVRVYSLEDGAWELLSPPAACALPGGEGSFILCLESCFAEGWSIQLLGNGGGGRWKGGEAKTANTSYSWTAGGPIEALSGENIPVALQVYDEYGPGAASGGSAGHDVSSFFAPESLSGHDAAYAVTLVFAGAG